MNQSVHAVTGAFGYSGKYIARRLLGRGYEVVTLTNSIHRANPFANQIKVYPFNFDDPVKLTRSLQNVSVLYNTYWVRFNHKLFQHADAVKNTITMFEAAKAAGVKRIVHVSILNPSLESPLEYFSSKATLEQALINSGISYAILRPAVLFGKEDILINNIAWFLRKFPLFTIFGDGKYRLQPIYVGDLAKLAVDQGQSKENIVIDAIGPETFTYAQLGRTLGDIIGKTRPVLSIPPGIGYLLGLLIGKIVGDVMITRDEIAGLMDDMLYSGSPPVGTKKLTEWAKEHADTLGLKYTSELARRIDRVSAYDSN